MSKTAIITLGGVDYKIHAFNMAEMQEVAELTETTNRSTTFKILAIALRRADPKVEAFDTIEASMDEINAAMAIINSLAGFRTAAATASPENAAV